MEYWRGIVTWEIDKDWKCDICGDTSHFLIWGLVHAECRCNRCHAPYILQDDNGYVTRPILNIKPEYIEPAKAGWPHLMKPLDELTPKEWEHAASFITKPQEA